MNDEGKSVRRHSSSGAAPSVPSVSVVPVTSPELAALEQRLRDLSIVNTLASGGQLAQDAISLCQQLEGEIRGMRAEHRRHQVRRDRAKDERGALTELLNDAEYYVNNYLLDEADDADVCHSEDQHFAASDLQTSVVRARAFLKSGTTENVSAETMGTTERMKKSVAVAVTEPATKTGEPNK